MLRLSALNVSDGSGIRAFVFFVSLQKHKKSACEMTRKRYVV